MEEISTSDLPNEMQSMTEEERLKYLGQKSKQRKELSDEIQTLNKKRDTYVAEQQRSESNESMLDKAILTSLKSQAKSRDFQIK